MLFIFILAVSSYYANAAITEHPDPLQKKIQRHNLLQDVCNTPLGHSYIYDLKRAQISYQLKHPENMPEVERALDAFAGNACYELTLGDSSITILQAALKLSSATAILHAFVTVQSYRKGHLSSEKELLLKTHADNVEAQNPDIIMLPAHNSLAEHWPYQWSSIRELAVVYQKSFVSTTTAFNPCIDTFQLDFPPIYGHFDPERFLRNLPQNRHKNILSDHASLAFVHFEEEHARRTAYAWLPALCHPQTRDLLEITLASYTDPDKQILKQFSIQAQFLCLTHEHHPNTCKNSYALLSKVFSCAPEDIPNTLEEAFTQKLLDIGDNPVLKHSTEIIMSEVQNQSLFSLYGHRVIVSQARASSIAQAFIEEKPDPQDVVLAKKTLCSVLQNHGTALIVTHQSKVTESLLEAQQNTRLHLCAHLLEQTFKDAPASLKNTVKSPGILLAQTAQKLCSSPTWILDKHNNFINGIWYTFDEYKVNVSEHQWKNAQRILRKLPWIQEFSSTHPKQCEDLLAYRKRSPFPDPDFETKDAYYQKFVRAYHAQRPNALAKIH